MTTAELKEFVLEFIKVAAPTVKCQFTDDGVPDDEASYMSTDEVLATWMQIPDCAFSSMFIGWMMGTGEDVNTFSPFMLAQAVEHALVGENKNVMFDWYGDDDATSKPH